jgi:hypothetical protein
VPDDPHKPGNTSICESPQDGLVDHHSDERRRSPRFPFTASIVVTELQSKSTISGRMTDLGHGGCYVDTLSPFPVGTAVKVGISRQEQTFEAQAKVVYSKTGMGMGLAFTAARREHIELLRTWLLELSGRSPADVPPEENELVGGVGSEEEEPQLVLKQLLMVLMQKGVLTETEGNEMLRGLNR